MCGRFTLSYREAILLAAELGVRVESLIDYKPRYNIAPTDSHWIVRSRFEDREVLPAKWGLVNFWMTDRKQAFKNINARAETIQTSRSLREAFKEMRCVIPADGFFEWTGQKDARQPIWHHRPDGGLVYFAGLYESWRPAPGEKDRTFTIITTTPNSLIEPIHNPHACHPRGRSNPRLAACPESSASLMALLRPARDDLLAATPVSSRVNSVKNDDPECLAPATQE